MPKSVQAYNKSKKNRTQLNTEIKLVINQRLFDKHIITEEMYQSAKEQLIKQAC